MTDDDIIIPTPPLPSRSLCPLVRRAKTHLPEGPTKRAKGQNPPVGPTRRAKDKSAGGQNKDGILYSPNPAERVKQICPNPTDVFLLMYPPTLRELTTEMSNLYSTQAEQTHVLVT